LDKGEGSCHDQRQYESGENKAFGAKVGARGKFRPWEIGQKLKDNKQRKSSKKNGKCEKGGPTMGNGGKGEESLSRSSKKGVIRPSENVTVKKKNRADITTKNLHRGKGGHRYYACLLGNVRKTEKTKTDTGQAP